MTEHIVEVYIYPFALAVLTVIFTYTSISNKFFKSNSLEAISKLSRALTKLSFRIETVKDGGIHFRVMDFDSLYKNYNNYSEFFKLNIIVDRNFYEFEDFIPFINDIFIPIEIKNNLNDLFFSNNDLMPLVVYQKEMENKYIGLAFTQKDKFKNHLSSAMLNQHGTQYFKTGAKKEMTFFQFITILLNLQNNIKLKTDGKIRFDL